MKNKILLVIVTICSVFLLTGCSKESIDAETFINKALDQNFLVKEEKEESVKKKLVASKDDKYTIEFLEFEDDNAASDFFKDRKKTFKNTKVSKSQVSTNGPNYNTFSITANNRYTYISRVDDTVLLVLADEEDKDEVKEVIKKYGY